MKPTSAVALVTLLFWAPLLLGAQQDSERIRFLRNIRIEAGEIATDAICFNCSIIVQGQLDGDAVAIGGDIVVQGTLRGDAVALGGSIRGDGENHSSGLIDIADRSSETGGRLPVSSSILAYRSPRG